MAKQIILQGRKSGSNTWRVISYLVEINRVYRGFPVDIVTQAENIATQWRNNTAIGREFRVVWADVSRERFFRGLWEDVLAKKRVARGSKHPQKENA